MYVCHQQRRLGGQDNDCDTPTDCEDPDCLALPTCCQDEAYCYDGELYTYDRCVDNICSNPPYIYGDVDLTGAVGIFDVFCILNGFGGDFSTCSLEDVDVETCGGNATVNIFDPFVVLNAFGGQDHCCGGPP